MDILVVFLFLVGVILLTGASLASAIRATGSGVADTTRMLKAHRPRSATTEAPAPFGQPESLQPPEPEPEELIVRATHVEAPPLDEPPAWESDPVDDAAEDPVDEAADEIEDEDAGESRRSIRRPRSPAWP